MNQANKEFIERNIDTIEKNDWATLIRESARSAIFFTDILSILKKADISDPLIDEFARDKLLIEVLYDLEDSLAANNFAFIRPDLTEYLKAARLVDLDVYTIRILNNSPSNILIITFKGYLLDQLIKRINEMYPPFIFNSHELKLGDFKKVNFV